MKRDVDQLRKEIADNDKSSLADYRELGVKQVEIYSALDDRCCPQCKAAHGTVLDVKEALKRPSVVPECTGQHCRCAWVPVVDL